MTTLVHAGISISNRLCSKNHKRARTRSHELNIYTKWLKILIQRIKSRHQTPLAPNQLKLSSKLNDSQSKPFQRRAMNCTESDNLFQNRYQPYLLCGIPPLNE